MRKLLAVIGSDDLRDILYQALKHDFDLTVCNNAQECKILLQQDYDGMILDLFLPGTDGLTLLESIPDSRPPVILALTRLYSDYLLKALNCVGVGYALRIPCPVIEIRSRLEDMFLKFDSPNPDAPAGSIQYHLHRLGLSPHWNGYHHLVYILSDYDSEKNLPLFKTYYPELSTRNSVSLDAIDNAIHYAILRAYQKRNDSVWKEYFQDTSKCPKNKEFICAIAERLE